MGKCTETIGRIERGRVMLYSEFPTIFNETPDGAKEGISEGVSGGAANSAPIPLAASARVLDAIADPFSAD